MEDLAGLQEEVFKKKGILNFIIFWQAFKFKLKKAENLDRILYSFLTQQKSQITHLAHFGSWILNNNLSIMNHFLVSGLELDLFSKFEYPYVYWYLCEVVLNWQISTLKTLDNFLQTNELNFPSMSIFKIIFF